MLKHFFSVVAIGVVFLLAGAGCASDREIPVSVNKDSQVSALTAPTIKEFVVNAKNWEFNPSTITVNKGDKVLLKIASSDIEHGFALKDFNVDVDLLPGQTKMVEFIADKAGSFTFHCNVPCGEGHREMRGTFIVK